MIRVRLDGPADRKRSEGGACIDPDGRVDLLLFLLHLQVTDLGIVDVVSCPLVTNLQV